MRFVSKAAVAAFLLLTFLALSSQVWAQTSTGEVNGTVSDQSGAVVPSATVRLVNTATNISTQTTTNSSGYFTFLSVKPGPYVLSVEQPGFKTARMSIEVGVNQTVTQNPRLAIGETSQSVEVSAEAEMLQSSSSELGTVIGERAVQELPLNGRNFTQLLTLTPGATPVSNSQNNNINGVEGSIGIPGSSFSDAALQGQNNRSKVYFYDGIINTSTRGPYYIVLPNVDLVQEFKVVSHDQRPEFGGVAGGVVNIVSSPGTNRWHGSAFEFVRNNFFDARDTYKDRGNTGPAPFHQNQFGATFGGPIIKDRTFFSVGYDGWRYSKPSQTRRRVPTDAELAGDFSASGVGALYNPFSTRSVGGVFVRDRFMCDVAGNPLPTGANGTQVVGTPCNKLPTSLISSMMQGFFKTYYDRPNLTGVPGVNFQVNKPSTNNTNSWQARADHRLTNKDNLFFRFSEQRIQTVGPIGDKAANIEEGIGRNWGGGWVRSFTPNLLLDVRGGVATRPTTFTDPTHEAGVDPLTKLGFTDAARFHGLLVELLSPYVQPGNIREVYGIGGLGDRGNPNWSTTGDLSWTRGNHSIKTGLQYINVERLQVNTQQTYHFTNDVTGIPADPTSGVSLASALLGLPSLFDGQLAEASRLEFKLGTWSTYLQDQWRVSRRLTLNYGLRYDYLTQPQVLAANGLQQGPDIDHQLWLIGADSLPLCSQSGKAPCIPGAGLSAIPFGNQIKFVGKKNFIPAPVKDNWGPRIGGAYQLTDKMVLRGGYGLYWDALPARSQYTQHNEEFWGWPVSGGFSGTANAIGTTPKTIQNIQGNFAAVLPPPDPWESQGWFNDPKRKDGYSHEWNAEIQREMTRNLLLSVAYVGSSSGRLEYSGLGNTATKPSPSTATQAQINALRPFPAMGGGAFYSRSIGESKYNSLQVKAQHRFSNGLQSLLSYTWSKCTGTSSGYFAVEDGPSAVQNYYDPNSNRGVCSYDIPHFLSWYTVYELPAGRGKPYFQSGPASWFLGNWELNYVLQARSGQPYNLTVNGDQANIGNGVSWWNYERPNLVGNPHPGNIGSDMAFDPNAFQTPAPGTFGTFGRNKLRSNHVFNMDLSLFKKIPLGETPELQLRFESFNVFNIVNPGVPQTTIGQADTGRVSSLADGTNPREMQFGLRFVF